nr:hypothetical protein [Tanacetum cinerariifolium]
MLCEWRIRKKGSKADPYVDYGKCFFNCFCLKINHGGAFTPPLKIRYKGGKVNWVDTIDSDVFSVVEVIDLYVDHSVTKETINVDESLLVNELDNDLFIGNEMLGDNDEDVIEDVSEDEWLHKSLRLVGIKKKHAVEKDNVRGQSSMNESMNVNDDRDDGSNSDNGSTSDDDSDSQDSDFLVDPDNMIDDVDVDMAEFRSNIDANVEWVGSKAIVTIEEEEFEKEGVDHNELDSGSDYEYEGERKKALKMYHKMKKANVSNAESGGTTWKENFYVGLKFSNNKEIKEMVTRVAVEQIRELHYKKNDKVRVRCICRGKVPQFGCEDGDDDSGSKGLVSSGSKGKGQSKEKGQVSGSKGKSNNKTKAGEGIKDKGEYCPWSLQCSKLPNEETWAVKTFKDTHKYQLQRQYEVRISKQKVFRAKKMAQERVEGPLKDGFKACKRNLLGLDGCFLSGSYPGWILTAVGVDLNNGIYPLAYAIVESENKDSWKWFLECVGDDLDLFRNSNFTFILDRQKGIIPAIAESFSSAEHRFCFKHIYDNMKLSWRGHLKDGFKAGKKDLLGLDGCFLSGSYPGWILTAVGGIIPAIAVSFPSAEHRFCLKHIYDNMKLSWRGRAHCDVLLNNMCEVFNRQLVDGRDKHIITCLEFIREYLMKRIVNVQKVIRKSDGPLTPNATKVFNIIVKEAGQMKELTGIPCKHVLAAIWDMAGTREETAIPESYCHQVHWLSTWKDMYMFKVNP